MNILLGKFGQKVIFNRESKECDRSNTNGNVGTYLLFKLLIENNKKDTFYIASENDLSTFEKMPFENVVDASDMDWEYLEGMNIDAMFVLTGLTQFEKDDRFIKIVNWLSARFILLSDDPRCLDSVSEDFRITRQPNVIISQFSGMYNFKDVAHEVRYEPIERASCYGCKVYNEEKEIDMIIISNTSGKEYDRVKILSNVVNGSSGINIYGRLSDDEKESLGKDNCKGEVKYTEMQSILRKSSSTFMVPIKKGWVTSKYVESLMNGVLPIFHEDYNTSLLEAHDLIIVRDKEEFSNVLKEVKENKRKVDYLVKKWTKLMIEPFTNGKKLSNILMRYVR